MVNKSILVVIDRKTNIRLFFAGFDTSVKGFCRWSKSSVSAVRISNVNIIEQLKRYLVINSVFDYSTHRFEIIDETNLF